MSLQPALRVIASHVPPGPAPARSVALIGNYPPRRCGIATFTADVYGALRTVRREASCEVYALTDIEGAYRYPAEVVCEIRQNDVGDYLAAAARLNATRPDVICVQHEFGIFGGAAGEHLLTLLGATDLPVVATLHTVLETPSEDQRSVFSRLLARSARLIVMAERGREILRRAWGAPEEKILVIPHGAPDRPLAPTEAFKVAIGFAGRDLLLTFGLLSPGKGIENVVQALPRIVKDHPKATYVVLGATHPHLLAREGERYRHSLTTLAQQLGVEDYLRLINTYTDEPQLVEHLRAADIYITPYLKAEQITSGTLAYAAALGRPIVSTPYWHAAELLADGRGRLTPFGSPDAVADEVIDLLAHPDVREVMSRRIYDAGRETVWARFGVRMFETFDRLRAQRVRPTQAAARPGLSRTPMTPSLGGLQRMTDTCGMLQHSLFSVPDRRHGYCVDDNARALILMHRMESDAPSAERATLDSIYAAFVSRAWNDEEGRFRNFMSYEREWLEPRGSEDSTGRGVWAVATTAALARDPEHRRWASNLIDRIVERSGEINSPRANAFMVLGLCAMIEAGLGGDRVRAFARAKSDGLAAMLRLSTEQDVLWFEDYLSYDNARLPEALIRAGGALHDPTLIANGVEALTWLCCRQTGPFGHFLPVATVDFGRPLRSKNLFDQQPVEAAATIDACEAAWTATRDRRWIEEAERAYEWFFGANSLGVSMSTSDGDCFDGLTWAGVNENQGAESVLALQFAVCTIRKLTELSAPRVKMVGDA